MVNKNKEKEPERDLVEKKRRKGGSNSSTSAEPSNTGGTVGSSSSSNIINSKILKEDIYANVVKFEENESVQRSSDTDSMLFRSTCNDLRTLFQSVCNLKKNNTEKAKLEINDKRIDGSYMFVILKKLNRLDKVRLRTGRDVLHKEKLRVDSNILQLQNLLYEADHLKKEVQRCLQFKSQDEEIELVSEKEFYKEAPEEISRVDKTGNDEHARRLARLEWELQQRKELATLCKELQMEKEKVATDIESKIDRLDSLAPRLDALLTATRPLQEALEMNIENDWEVQKIARLLPQPLYLAYANLNAYAEACNKLLVTTIHGDEEEAKQLENIEKDVQEDVEDDESENDDVDNERISKSYHIRRLSKTAIIKLKQTNVIKPHPLHITFVIRCKNIKPSLKITLYYLPILGFVTAYCNLIDFENVGCCAVDVIAPHTILNCLTDDDYGESNYNSKIIYQLKELLMEPEKLTELLNEKQLGKPYKWVQRLCGLDFVVCNPLVMSNNNNTNSNNLVTNKSVLNNVISYELAQESVPDIVKRIRKRWMTRLKLHKEIYELEQRNIDKCITNDVILINVSGKLTLWESITWTAYTMEKATIKFIEENFVNAQHLLFRCVIERKSVKLIGFISVSPNFPDELPIWALSIQWDNTIKNSQNNSTIREMEHWINSVDKTKKIINCILSIQLKRAMSSLDIYLETESINNMIGGGGELPEFPQDKTFLHAFRGRTRARPFKFLHNGGNNIFTHV